MVKPKRSSGNNKDLLSPFASLASSSSSSFSSSLLPPQLVAVMNQIPPQATRLLNVLSTNRRAQLIASVTLFLVSFLVFRSSSSSSVVTPLPAGSATIRKAQEQQPQSDNLLLSTAATAATATQQTASTTTATGTTDTTTSSITSTTKCNWRPEPLPGVCDNTKPTPESKLYKTATECEEGCCASDTCVTFQFRAKEGCQFGGDARLGAEGDGPGSWCEPRPPGPWHGQRIKKKDTGEAIEGACTDAGWNAKELSGQCFGLGSKRTNVAANTAEACRDACCADDKCGIWQWRLESGCFYHKGGHSCQDANPLDYEAFKGKRKVQSSRSYTPYAYTKDFADMAGFEKTYQK